MRTAIGDGRLVVTIDSMGAAMTSLECGGRDAALVDGESCEGVSAKAPPLAAHSKSPFGLQGLSI